MNSLFNSIKFIHFKQNVDKLFKEACLGNKSQKFSSIKKGKDESMKASLSPTKSIHGHNQ